MNNSTRGQEAFGFKGILASAKIALVLLLVSGFTAGAVSQLERVDPETEVPSVSVDELARAVEDGKAAPVLIDVRLKEDFDTDPVLLPNAHWRDPHDADAWADELSPDTPVVVYCVAGRWVSQSVTKKLRDMGLNVSQLTGGIEAWQKVGKPTTSATKP